MRSRLGVVCDRVSARDGDHLDASSNPIQSDAAEGVSGMSEVNTASTAPGGKGTRSLALRLCIWAGIVGPVLYCLVFTIDGALRPGYSPIREAVSYLLLG